MNPLWSTVVPIVRISTSFAPCRANLPKVAPAAMLLQATTTYRPPSIRWCSRRAQARRAWASPLLEVVIRRKVAWAFLSRLFCQRVKLPRTAVYKKVLFCIFSSSIPITYSNFACLPQAVNSTAARNEIRQKIPRHILACSFMFFCSGGSFCP